MSQPNPDIPNLALDSIRLTVLQEAYTQESSTALRTGSAIILSTLAMVSLALGEPQAHIYLPLCGIGEIDVTSVFPSILLLISAYSLGYSNNARKVRRRLTEIASTAAPTKE